ncbi:MAG TPA: glucokinase [Dokdonella sp.]|uniref:glucokinase n=1 Tax=Dokdonella sp. TaxID=2291710 RepID=UPI0025C30F36|nr:glucokinase [Dokdonella sp.]MBX3691788.1 glucokinase [Dokdonella sp.]MCW5568910.1 glucokinase [Dokdonella sp.]HNR90789.1 glucokinase [Dokdonella sp.]
MNTLLADVGGTNVRFALADTAARDPLLTATIRRYRVADFADFSAAARRYLTDQNARPRHAVFAFAGPVGGDLVHITNHPWSIDLSRLRAELELADGLRAINDFAAMSHAVCLLRDDDTARIGVPAPAAVGAAAQQTFAVVGPGTGLGVGALVAREGHVDALSSEGGHLSFAPRNEHEIDLLRRLAARFGRVSNERLLCGAGLVNLYSVLAEIDGVRPDVMQPEDITARADAGSDPRSVRTVELFCELLGAVAGDVVLAFAAWDGVYLTGGLTPRLRPWLERGAFRARFEDKGRFAARLAEVPTVAVLHADAGLLGCAARAVLDAGGRPQRAPVHGAGA